MVVAAPESLIAGRSTDAGCAVSSAAAISRANGSDTPTPASTAAPQKTRLFMMQAPRLPVGSYRCGRCSHYQPQPRRYQASGRLTPELVKASSPWAILRSSSAGQGEDMPLRFMQSWCSGLIRSGVAAGVLAAAFAPGLTADAAPAPADAPPTAAAIDPSLFAALRWRGIGPYRGGRALAAAGVPGDPTTFFFGAVAGGVWKTTDGGASWLPLTDNPPISSVGAIAIAASDRNIIYVGTGEAAPRGDMTYGDGVYKSVDGGKTWSSLGLKDTRQIGALIVDPHNPDIVLVAALGHAFGPNPERGVFRTTDGGKSWTKVLYKDEQTGAIDVCFDPHDAKIVYAALWQARRQPWNFSSGGPGSGLYRSSDGGVSWTRLSGNGLPAGILGRIHVAVSGADSKRVYAMIEAADG